MRPINPFSYVKVATRYSSESCLYSYPYLLGLLAKIKCSICSNQCESWFSPFGGRFFHIYFWTAWLRGLPAAVRTVSGGVHLSPVRPTKLLLYFVFSCSLMFTLHSKLTDPLRYYICPLEDSFVQSVDSLSMVCFHLMKSNFVAVATCCLLCSGRQATLTHRTLKQRWTQSVSQKSLLKVLSVLHW